MLLGILGGVAAAAFNSVDFLFRSRFLLCYKSPVCLLVVGSVTMMVMSLPFLFFLVPFASVPSIGKLILTTLGASCFFLIGQGSFMTALRYMEASRLSSLLGLKILVLSVIFMLSGHWLNRWQLLAVFVAATAAVMFNWTASKPIPWKGWIFLLLTLIGFSVTDMFETSLVEQIRESSDFSNFRSAMAVVPLLYTSLGLLLLPGLFFYKPGKDQFCKAFPHAVLWLISQVFLLACFGMVLPVFGNVILATRGIFSVILGALLPIFGLAALDSQIPAKMWIRRGIAALLMLAAIAIYSFATVK